MTLRQAGVDRVSISVNDDLAFALVSGAFQTELKSARGSKGRSREISIANVRAAARLMIQLRGRDKGLGLLRIFARHVRWEVNR